ncbi:MAG: hypothetical protein ACLT74_07630 [Christensenellales bacterium]
MRRLEVIAEISSTFLPVSAQSFDAIYAAIVSGSPVTAMGCLLSAAFSSLSYAFDAMPDNNA